VTAWWRREPDQAAQLENEKGAHNAKGHDNQTRIETDPGQQRFSFRPGPLSQRRRRTRRERPHSSALIGSGVALARAFTGRRRKSGT
jgi:hypothetical protein